MRGWQLRVLTPAWCKVAYPNVAGKSQGRFVQGMLLGLVLTVGDQIVYRAV